MIFFSCVTFFSALHPHPYQRKKEELDRELGLLWIDYFTETGKFKERKDVKYQVHE